MKSILVFLTFMLMSSLCFGASNCGEYGEVLWKKELKLPDGDKMKVELSCIDNCYQAALELGDGTTAGTAKTCNEELDKGWTIDICGLVLDKFDGTLSDVAKKAESLCNFMQNRKSNDPKPVRGSQTGKTTATAVTRYYPIKDETQNAASEEKSPAAIDDTRQTNEPAARDDAQDRLEMHPAQNAESREIGLLAGSNAGTYIKVARDIQAITKDIVNLRVDQGGSLININRLLTDRRAQFAIVQYDALLYKKAYEDSQLDKKISIILPLYNEEIHLIVNRNAGINNLSDLNGKKVDTDKMSSGCWVTATIIKDRMNLNWQEHYLPPVEAIKGVINGDLDAFFYVCGQPAPFLKALGEDASEFIKLVPVDMDAVYPSTVIKAETYPWLKEDVRTNMTPALLVTWNYWKRSKTNRFNDYVDGIRKIVSRIIAHLDDLKSYGHPKWKEVNPFEYRSLKWPLHDEALEVLQQKQYGSDHEKKKEKLFELLKKYM